MRHGLKNFYLDRLHLGCLLRHLRGCQTGKAEPKPRRLCLFLYAAVGTDQAVPAGEVTKDTGSVAEHFF